MRELMAPRKHEGVLPLQRVRGVRGRVAGRGDAQLGRRSLNLRCIHAFGLILLEPALRQYVATERFSTPACDLDVECLHKVRSSVADHISKE